MNNICNPRLNFKCVVLSPNQLKFLYPMERAANYLDRYPKYTFPVPLNLSEWKDYDGKGDQLFITGEDLITFERFAKKHKNRIPVTAEEIEIVKNTAGTKNKDLFPIMVRSTKGLLKNNLNNFI